ncbi:MAG: hypothetical protein HQL08_08710 [Nitrospirae bacterium]|nr:hypothetical protein [Nitrospirota bacterium]
MNSLIDKLKQKEAEKNKDYEVKFWKPEAGEILEGKVTDMGNTITREGDAEFMQIEIGTGKFMVFVNSVLSRLMEDEGVQIGDTVAVKFLGLIESNKNKKRKFKDYVLVKADTADSDNSEQA